MDNYKLLKSLLLRSPHYSYSSYTIEHLPAILKDLYFQTALYLASPPLFHSLEIKNFEYNKLSDKEQLSVKRYYNRMSFRPTPFGSFSAFSITKWGKDQAIQLVTDEQSKLHLNIDQEFVFYLAQTFSDKEIDRIYFACNPSVYAAGGEFRYLKTTVPESGRITFELESYEKNSTTSEIINYCQEGFKSGAAIVIFIDQLTNCGIETARDYLNFLIESQILKGQNELNIIGEDYLQRQLNTAETNRPVLLTKLKEVLRQLDNYSYPDVNTLLQISEQLALLQAVKPTIQQNNYFYAGLEKQVFKGSLPDKYQQPIMDGLTALAALVPPTQPSILQQFVRDFKARYDRQKVPLLQALDPESGIGYGTLTAPKNENELLKKVNFTTPGDAATLLEWSATHRLLLEKWNQNELRTAPITLDEKDLAALPKTDTLPGPPSLSVMFSVIDEMVSMETIGGASGTALIGRFGNWSAAVHELSKNIAEQEQSANPNVLFADIGQLSDNHADNINRRKHSYAYEIPVNVISTLPEDRQIGLADLSLSVVNDRLILESSRLKKIIIPRLSSAYNYSRNNLAVFRLLCDLQYQGVQGNYTLELEQFFPGMNYYPRVVYKNTILSVATWHLHSNDLQQIIAGSDEMAIYQFQAFQLKNHIPTHIALSKFDQQLLFDTGKKAELLFLIQCLKGQSTAVFQEVLIPQAPVAFNNEQYPLRHQFVAFFHKPEPSYAGITTTAALPNIEKAQEEFIIGDKWLYLKIYCNPEIANELLTKKIAPLLREASGNEVLSWFFIRYHDPGYHIRLRLKMKPQSIGPLLLQLRKRLARSMRFNLIRDYQADTYRRELERYGSDMINIVEEFFNGSSVLVLKFIQISTLKSFSYTYHSLGFVSVNDLLDHFFSGINEQITFLQKMVDTFYGEFSGDKSLKVDLDLKYREIGGEINLLLSGEDYYQKTNLTAYAAFFNLKAAVVAEVASNFTIHRQIQLLADLIHMHLNRLFIARQRQQELIVYYCLLKYKKAVSAISKRIL